MIEIHATDFKYPHLAHRTTDEDSYGSADAAKASVWAVATNLIAILEPGATIDEFWSRFLAEVGSNDYNIEALPLDSTYLITTKPSAIGNSPALILRLPALRVKLNQLALLEEDILYFIQQTATKTPNDTHFNSQDDLRRLLAEAAWTFGTGKEDVRVAVIDTGVDHRHPDLTKNICRVDNKIIGYDYYNDNKNPDDDHYHGTWCAGILGAEGDNGGGITGVNWRISIIPIKFMDDEGRGDVADAIRGIDFAIKNNASVILAAWGSFGPSSALQLKIEETEKKGISFIAAAGNFNVNLDTCPFYPASLPVNNILSIAATSDADGPLLDWGHGKKRVHLAAPGCLIYSTIPTRWADPSKGEEPYRLLSGTSGSAAFIAGAAALLKAQDMSRDYTKIHPLLEKSAVDPKQTIAGKGLCKADGRLDLLKAVLP